MKAVIITEKKGLVYRTVSEPVLQDDEVLIQVKACGVNRLDLLALKGNPSVVLPHIPGSDVSGIIKEIKGKTSLEIGHEVVVNPAIPCKKCSRCKRALSCSAVSIFGYKTEGGYAEYVVAPIEQVYLKPKNLSFVEAAAFPITFLTAWHMLVSRANLQDGETVFVWGASGGLGVAAIQIAKHLGAKVIAAIGSERNIKKVKEIGADHVILYTKDNIVEEVDELTNGEKVQVVFESIGKSTWNTSIAILEPYGRYVIAGTTSGSEVNLNLYNLYKYQYSLMGASMGTKEEFEKILQLFSKGKLTPIIDKTFPLKQAAQALTRMETGKHFGKIVIEI